MIRVICIRLVSGVRSFFIINVLIGHNGIEDRMLGFIEKEIVSSRDLMVKLVV